jgi:hypothetical protein
MIKQKLQNIFKKQVKQSFFATQIKQSFFATQIKKTAPITANFLLSNAITMQASVNGGRLRIR